MFPLDFEILLTIQQWQPTWLTVMMRIISWLLTPEVILPLCGAVLIVLAMEHKRWQEYTLLAMLSGNILTLILKPLFHIARPIPAQAAILDYQGNYSFPSGHAMAIMTLGAAIVLLAHHQRRAPMWLVAVVSLAVLLVGVSRVYLGAHWPSDVVGGWLLGWLWSAMVWRYLRPKIQQHLG